MKKISTILLGLFLITPFLSSGQTEEEKIKSIITEFIATANEVRAEGHKAADELMAYLSPDFEYDYKSINIMNNLNHEKMNYEQLRFFLMQLKRSSLKIKRTINGPIVVDVQGIFAHASYSSTYEIYDGDNMINRGRQYIDIILKKAGDAGWKFQYVNSIEIDDLEYKGTCVSTIFQTQTSNKIIVETILPDGANVELEEKKFTINKEFDPRMVRVDFKQYQWYNNGQLFKVTPEGAKGEQLGAAKSEQEMILMLLKSEIYADRCFNVVRKLK